MRLIEKVISEVGESSKATGGRDAFGIACVLAGIASALAWVLIVIVCLQFCSCIPTMLRARDAELMYEQSLGYRGPDSFERYAPPTVTKTTEWGVRYAGNVDPAKLDSVVRSTLECLHAEQRRVEFVVLVPEDAGEVLPVRAYSAQGDCGKALTGPGPCMWRDGVRGPAASPTLISVPSLVTLPRAIAVWVRGPDYYLRWAYNPWADPETAKCLGPWENQARKEVSSCL